MEPLIENSPHRVGWKFIVMIASIIVLILVSGALGYLYYKLLQENKSLRVSLLNATTTITPTDCAKEAVTKEVPVDNNGASALCEKEVIGLNSTLDRYDEKIKIALMYNEAFNYIVDTIIKYQGLDGWADSEYERAMEIARNTGNQDLIQATEDAWSDPRNQPAEVRLAIALAVIQENIQNALTTVLKP